MTQEEKQVFLKDISARLPYGVKVLCKYFPDYGEEPIENVFTLNEIDTRLMTNPYWIGGDQIQGKGFSNSTVDFAVCIDDEDVQFIKPYLRHINDVTEDELADFAHIIYDDIVEIGHTNKGFINVKLSSNPFWCQINNRTLLKSWKGIDFMNSIHVDYRGLLDKELAIRVTKHIDWYPMFADYYEIYGKPEKKEPRKLLSQ